jgi:hypothetical protein
MRHRQFLEPEVIAAGGEDVADQHKREESSEEEEEEEDLDDEVLNYHLNVATVESMALC